MEGVLTHDIFAFSFYFLFGIANSLCARRACNQIEHEAAEKLAADFLTDMYLEETFPEEHEIDFTKYTSVEKFIKYMELHMQKNNNNGDSDYDSGYDDDYIDDYIFEANAIIF